MFVRAIHVLSKYSLSLFVAGLFYCVFAFASGEVFAQAVTFAGNAQHTSNYPAPAQNLNVIKWTANIDLNNTGTPPAHYGSPLITASNTVLVPIKTAGNGFKVDAFNGATGSLKYSVGSDYILPTFVWIPVYNPCVTTGAFGTRMYYAGAGGTIWHIDNPDSNSPGPPVREVFYTSLAGYNANAAAYNSTIFVNSPITADAAGNIYFGFRVQGTAPAPLSTNQSGFARIGPGGFATFVLAGTAAGDNALSQVSHNVAPALSNDGNTLYVVVKGSGIPKLLGLDATTLATKFSVSLRDPRNGNAGVVTDQGTASPMVAPDGDVYFGIQANPSNGSRGFLLRFSGDLSVVKTPGAFGWDYTAGVVPASMVPGYTGSSTYLLFCKYNDYAFADGNGINRVALLDPNDTEIEPHTSSAGLTVMREVLTVIGPTQDPGPVHNTFPYAVKEWCINAPAVNPPTKSVFFTSEDGRSYRWNLVTNTLDQAVVLTQGIGEPYVPTVIGPDGTVYTLNGGTLFALGSVAGVDVVINSSSPDLRTVVVGSSITFTATVTGTPANPTGTVTFTDFTYNGTTAVTTTLATNVPLDANGHASVTTSSLTAGGAFLGNHLITASYSGDGSHAASSLTMLQKIHANATSTGVTAAPNPSSLAQTVTFTAVVSGLPSGSGTPTGMVTFQDGSTVIGQVPLASNGSASITKSNLTTGTHSIVATYVSDTQFAASAGSVNHLVQNATSTAIASSLNPSSFGQTVTFTATVSPANLGPGIPTGSVAFKDGAVVLGTVQLDVNGKSTLSTSSLSIGSHTITAEFTGTNGWLNSSSTVTQVVNDPPLLLKDEPSEFAAALDSVTQLRDPFSLLNPHNLSTDSRNRVSLFVWRLGLLPSDTIADLIVVAEDDQARTYDLVVVYIGPLPGVSEVTQVVVRLPDNVVGAPRDLWVKVGLRGTVSNRATIKIAAP
ncbi:MAG: Ig-like domain-containing protein [Acidobacteriota bacterium]